MALEDAGPVLPVLVAEDWAVEAPEFPEVAVGSTVALMLPPSPPLAVVEEMESPPVTRMAPVLAPPPMLTPTPPAKLALEPVGPVRAPPVPPVRRAVVRLAALPVSPETESAADWAPELALESADPRPEASPVSPESPEAPEKAAPSRVVEPLRPLAVAWRSAPVGPVAPLGPESPETA